MVLMCRLRYLERCEKEEHNKLYIQYMKEVLKGSVSQKLRPRLLYIVGKISH